MVPCMGHPNERHAVSDLSAEEAASVAATLQALSTPSRLRILVHLRNASSSVTALAEAVDMEQSAVSHQLRHLRALGLVTGRRHGRQIVYSLYDTHVAQLLDQAIHHVEHLGMGEPDPPEVVTAGRPDPPEFSGRSGRSWR